MINNLNCINDLQTLMIVFYIQFYLFFHNSHYVKWFNNEKKKT